MKQKFITSSLFAALVISAGSLTHAQDAGYGERSQGYPDPEGDHIENRLDHRGDRKTAS